VRTSVERFWSKVAKTEGCWNWTGALAGHYGQCRSAPNVKVPAHRFSWVIHFGAIPDDQMVLHRCDNRICVNPGHLFLGDARTNMRDMVEKGRHPKQLASYRAKLTPADVRAIRSSSATTVSLARMHHVDPSTIRAARKGLAWKNL
jgi:hypothetical protein